MPKAKSTTKDYIDVQVTDFSKAIQARLKDEAKAYQQLKAHKLETTRMMAEAFNPKLKNGKQVVAHGHTAWGQLQVHVDFPKAKASNGSGKRPSLAEYLATQN